MSIENRNLFECKVCGYKWFSKLTNQSICPNCRSYIWRDGTRKSRLGLNRSPKTLEIENYARQNPCVPITKLGEKFGVTRERIRQIKTRAGIKNNSRDFKGKHCLQCGRKLPQINKGGFCNKCRRAGGIIPLICDECGKLFYRRKGHILNYYREHYFCSNKCKGKFVGTHYGFAKTAT